MDRLSATRKGSLDPSGRALVVSSRAPEGDPAREGDPYAPGELAQLMLAERRPSTILNNGLGGASEPLVASVVVAQWRPGQTSQGLRAPAAGGRLHAKATGGATVVQAGDVAAGAGRGVAVDTSGALSSRGTGSGGWNGPRITPPRAARHRAGGARDA
jgi:hypothetical protein